MLARKISLLFALTIIIAFLANLVFWLNWQDLSVGYVFIAIFSQTILATGLFIVGHDAMHGIVGSTSRTNNLIGYVACFLYGAFSFSRMREAHQAHHRDPTGKSDPDYPDHGDENFFRWVSDFIRKYYTLREFAYMHIHIVAIYLYCGSFTKLFAFYAAPVWFSAFQLFYFGTYLPHKGFQGQNTDPRTNPPARSNSLWRILSFITCFHFGYHREHHIHPHLAWWQLPKARWKGASH